MEKRKEREKEEQIRTQNRLMKGLELIVQKAKKKGIITSNSVGKIKKRPKSKWEERESPKKSLNNSVLSNNRNAGNNSFLIKVGNKTLISTQIKKRSKSVRKK